MTDSWVYWFTPLCGQKPIPEASLFSLLSGDRRVALRAGDAVLRGDVLEACGEADGLRMELKGRVFPTHRAAEWTVWLENRGGKGTEILSDIRAADLCGLVEPEKDMVYSGIQGDQCSGDSFLPFERSLRAGDRYLVTPAGGRSSNAAFPFFDLSDGEGGVIIAIGWSGQWQYEISRDGDSVSLRVGLEDARFYLKPGERVRLPRVLVKAWSGDFDAGHNDFRALLRESFAPRTPGGELVSLPAAIQCFDRYFWTLPYWSTEEGQKECLERAARIGGIDTLWLDAAWFERGFPLGVGNYSFEKGFPNGLSPVSRAAHERGMKFMVWFEPERVVRGTEVDREHPGWVTFRERPDDPGDESGLLNLARPEVVDWLIEKLSSMIRDNGIDIYRQDFNIDPLPFWRQLDEPGRQGITEIGHVTGFYRLWDALLQRFPGLVIDNCASGGRRIDLETCSRAVPLWRSDTGCAPSSAERPSNLWNQNQTLSLSKYLLFHAVCAWNPAASEFRAAATAGIACDFGIFSEDFDYEEAAKCLREFVRLRPYWTGDFYPLTKAGLDETQWSGFQFHRADLDAGMAMLFRRKDCGEDTEVFTLRGVEAGGMYELTLSDEKRRTRQQRASGKALLAGCPFTVAAPGESLCIEYRRVR